MKNNKGKNKDKNTTWTAEGEEKLTYFSSKRRRSRRLSPEALLAAFFGKLIKFKTSTRETTFALINPFKLLSVANRETFQCKYAFLTDSHASS